MSQQEYPKIYLYKRVVHAKMFIDENYEKPLDLNLVSDEAAFSKFHFIRLFKKIYGLTPHLYLRRVRLENAKLFLEQGYSVVNACEFVGFESVGTFTSLFKKEMGITPAVFQQRRIYLQNEMNSRPIQFVPNCFAESNGWKEETQF